MDKRDPVLVFLISFFVGLMLGTYVHPSISEAQQSSVTVLDEVLKMKDDVKVIKTEVMNIKRQQSIMNSKLDELRNSIKKVSASQVPFTIDLNKSSYTQGDRIQISGTVAPLKSVEIQLVDKDEFILSRAATHADSSGKFAYSLKIPTSLKSGNYIVRILQENKNVDKLISIGEIETSKLLIRTDKTTYKRGSAIIVSGNAMSNSDLHIVITLPNADTTRFVTHVRNDGTFSDNYFIRYSDQLGIWTISIEQGNQRSSISVFVTD